MTTTPFRAKAAMTVCGYCHDGKHDLCPHAVRNGNKGLWLCACAGPNCGGKILSCIRCKKVHDDVTPKLRICIDQDACEARVQTKRDANPVFQEVTRIQEKRMAEKAENTTTRVKVEKVGTCIVTGKPTKGGLFAPGMDARYVSDRVADVVGKKATESQARKKMKDDGVSEKLIAKFDKALNLARERASKDKEKEAAKATAAKEREVAKAAAAKEKAEKKAAAKAAAEADAATVTENETATVAAV